ncbi:hypothetical protein M3N55_02460 [Roseibaca sp. V10]|uniref:Sulfotransferase family protein n=1 Tax=Roseinatronobacter domitianus TaxID=2940293 RepID=A0ABT0LYX3_9RHOB|nr:hypothetical protein [Roseibaca domitiana]MCL1627583.1 hypothetical protein [Roseibaca domitiana]
MKAVIHIGMPKSGTSTIQAFLDMNRDALSQRGVLYDRFDPRFGSQFELAIIGLSAVGRQIPPQFERKLLNLHTIDDVHNYTERYAAHLSKQLSAQNGHHCFVGSSEHLYAWLNSVEQIEALDKFLSQRFSQVQYILYLRAQEELVLSSYSEAIRRVHSHSLAQHLAASGRINHYIPVERWVGAVGRERLVLRVLSPDMLKDGDLLTDFCHHTGIGASDLLRPGRVNTAMSMEEVQIRRVLNRVLPRQGRDGDMHPLYRVALKALLATRRNRTPLALTKEQRAEIRQMNSPQNEALRQRFLPHLQTLF